MANTALLQAVTQMLMQGRPPSPMAPIPSGGFTPPGGLGSLMPILEAEPSVAPVAPMPARDESLIEQLTGPKPVAPVNQPVSLLQKIALALQGFGAGVQGQGPQFLAQLDEQRQRPMREFQAATEQFEDRRRRAVGFAEEKQQRGQADIQRRADIQSDRDFQMRELDVRDRMQEARDLRQQAAALEREERKAQKEKEEQEAKNKAQQERDARLFTSAYRKAGAGKYAEELGKFDAGLIPKLSKEAAEWESAQVKIAELRARRLEQGGAGSGKESDNAASLERQFDALKAQFLRAEQPTKSMPYGDRALQQRIAAQYPAVMSKLEKLGYEVGFDPSGIYPYKKPPQGRGAPAQAAAPQGQQNDPNDLRRY